MNEKKKNNMKYVRIPFSKEIYKELEDISIKHDMKLPSFLKSLIMQWLNKPEK